MWFGGGVVGGLVESRNYHSIPDPFIRQQMSSQFHAPKLKKKKQNYTGYCRNSRPVQL